MPKAKNSQKSPRITVVTPIHDGLAHTLPYLESIYATGYDNLEVIIVDDGSTDNSAEIIPKDYPDTVILKGDGSLWWTGATNLGVQEALKRGTDYIFTVNNDVTLNKDIFKNLISCAESDPKSLIGCKIYYMDDHDKVWYFGGHLDDTIADVNMVHGRDGDFTERQETGVLTGMGVLIPASVFDEIGLYDFKKFPHYLADSDFSLRAKAAGYKLFVDPDAKIYSDVGSSWLRKQLKHPTPKLFWDLFFHIRSPHALKIRWRFYRRYWPKQELHMMMRFYWLLAKKIIRRNPAEN